MATGGQKGIAGTVFQFDSEGNPIPLAFILQTLSGAKSRYFTGELDLLAVIHTLKRCLYLAALQIVKIHTRTLPRELIKANPHHSPRVVKWSLILSFYQAEFVRIHPPITCLTKYHQCLLDDEPDEGISRPITPETSETSSTTDNLVNHFGAKPNPNLMGQFGHLWCIQDTDLEIRNLHEKLL